MTPKNIRLILLISVTIVMVGIATRPTMGQATLYLNDIKVTMSGDIPITVLGNGIWHKGSESITTLDNSTIRLDGNLNASGTVPLFGNGDRTHVMFFGANGKNIRGSSSDLLTFHELTIDGGGDLTLERDIRVYDDLNILDGNLLASGYEMYLELDPTGNSGNPRAFGDGDFVPEVWGEVNKSRIVDGSIFLSGDVNSSFSDFPVNYGNLGLDLLSPGLSNISLTRSYSPQNISGAQTSIGRWFDVQSNAPVFGSMEVIMEWLSPDITGVGNESNLTFFRHFLSGAGVLDPGKSWQNLGLTQIDVVTDMAQLTPVDTVFGARWTMAECNSPAVTLMADKDVLCAGEVATIDAGSGSGWSYLWSTGETTQTISVSNETAMSETYSVTVTNADLCFTEKSITLFWEDYPVVNIIPESEEVCDGDTYLIDPTYGDINLIYNWSNGETTSTISHLSDGTQSIEYKITVTNESGCKAVDSILITDLPPLPVDLGEDINDCNGGPVTIDASNPAYPNNVTYLWSTDATTPIINVANAGTYSVTVSDIVTGCTNNDEVFVSIGDIQIDLNSITNASCFGKNDGAIDLTITNPEPMTDILWSNGTISEDNTGLPAGNYAVTVSDINGCRDSLINITVEEPTEIIDNPTIVQDSCGTFLGAVDPEISGGVPGYTYFWTQEQMPLPNASTPIQSGLAAGNYELRVMDANNCNAYFSYIIEGPISPLSLQLNNSIHPSCKDSNDGSIDIQVNGGVGMYSFEWSNGARTEDLIELGEGIYTITVTDDFNCTIEQSYTMTAPLSPVVTLDNIEPATCNDAVGSISISIDDQGMNYNMINWSNDADTEDISGLVAGEYSYEIIYNQTCSLIGSFIVPSTDGINTASVVIDDVCNNGSGSIFTNASGGTGTLTYNWSTGATSPNLLDLMPGEYAVTIQDELNCTLVNNYTITSPDLLTIAGSTSDVSCFGDENGFIDLVVRGGTEPYLYSWSNGATTDNLSAIGPGNYIVTVTDINNCSSTQSFLIEQPEDLVVTGKVQKVQCYRDNSGGVELSVNGGVGPFTYLWSNNTTDKDLAQVKSGTYFTTVTDANGCTEVASFSIDEFPELVSNSIIENDECNEGKGSIQSNITGGVLPYSYEWNNGSTNPDLNNLTPGDYYLTVTDANNCNLVVDFSITGSEPIIVESEISNVTCNEGFDGAIALSVSGGTPNYNYLWSNGFTDKDLIYMAAGVFSVTITDGNNCSKVEDFIISEPSAIMVNETIIQPSGQGVNDGAIDIEVSGGKSPYSYTWSTGDITEDIDNLQAGEYKITVTDDSDCMIEETFLLVDPLELLIDGSVTHPTCSGQANGSITLDITNGSGNYSYNWDNGATTATLMDLSAGIYQVTVTDMDNGFQRQESLEVIDPPVLEVELIIEDVSCHDNMDGSIEAIAIGGTPDYRIEWDNGEKTPIIENLSVGDYSGQIIDVNGCHVDFNASIEQPEPIVINGEVNPESELGAFDGSIDVSISGGVLPYNFQWSNGSITEDLTSIGVGVYEVTVTDANQCSIIESFTLSEVPTLTLMMASTNISCDGGSDGSIDITIEGGMEPYTYLWNDGNNDAARQNLVADKYIVTVTDAEGIIGIDSIVLTQPEPLTLDTNVKNITCNGDATGSISVKINGGLPPYNLKWNDGNVDETRDNLTSGIYTVTVTDSKACEFIREFKLDQPNPLTITATSTNPTKTENNGSIQIDIGGGTLPYDVKWNDGSTLLNRTELSSGMYKVTVNDDNGCQIDTAFVLIVDTLVTSVNITHPSCTDFNDGTIDLEIQSGGNPPYNYKWSNGASTQDINSLTAGTYTVTVTDDSDLREVHAYELINPSPIFIEGDAITPKCNGDNNGQITLHISGGTNSYTYEWSHDSNTGLVADNLVAGSYKVTVRDENNCVSISEFELDEPQAISASFEIMDLPCDGSPSGSISSTVKGGTEPYSYEWNNGASSPILNNLSAGKYTVTITDANTCLYFGEVSLEEREPIILDAEVSNVSCFNQENGRIELSTSVNSDDLTFQWSNGATTPINDELDVGNYFVTVTDQFGCEVEQNFTISQPSALIANLIAVNAGCNDNGGQLFSEVSGGTNPYTYAWSNGSNTADIDELAPGNYVLTVTDANGCRVTVSSEILESDEPLLVRFLSKSPINAREEIEFVDVSYPKPSSWSWDFGDGIGSSREEDPVYQYALNTTETISTYPVRLTAFTPLCRGELIKDVRVINEQIKTPEEEEPTMTYTQIEKVNVFPNPAYDVVNVDVIINQKDKVTIDLLTMNGQRLATYDMGGNSLYGKRIRIDHIPTGMYLIYVKSGKDHQAKKLIITR